MAYYRVGDGYRQRTYIWTPPERRWIGTNKAYAALTGTITASVNETDIVNGAKTLIITLTGDTWIAAGAGSFDLQRDEIIAGCDSDGSEALGWDLQVRDTELASSVVRTSDTVVTITWQASPLYDITAQEVISVTVPATAVVGGVAISATPTFTVDVTTAGWGLLLSETRNRLVYVS